MTGIAGRTCKAHGPDPAAARRREPVEMSRDDKNVVPIVPLRLRFGHHRRYGEFAPDKLECVRVFAKSYMRDNRARATSSIHRDGRIFYGYTEWHVNWRLWWTNESGGACKMTKVLTHVDATTTLPKLVNGTPSQLNQLYALQSALRVHELGHYALAKITATQIESEIGAMPEMEDCAALMKAANDLGQRTLNDYRFKEEQYDVDTQHGRTQGAWIE
jgi:predicted secreted Zn-dependent protease